MDDDKTEGEDLDATETVRLAGDTAAESSEIPASIGKYRILSKLGEGGMGVVYEAEQESPRRNVAVKVVRGGQFVDEQRIRMFQREADTLARLKHPNIGGIYESGRTADGQHFFAMELVRGQTLNVYMKSRPSIVDLQEFHFRLALLRKIANAVHYAHQRGVIHRDLKPSNIIVTDDTTSEDSRSSLSGTPLPEIKILDFGLARITEGDMAVSTIVTEIGTIKGTLPYMSPEQARGNPQEIDVRTDVYSLGVILYEMLAGQRPYDVMARSVAEAVRVICDEPPRSLGATITGIRRLDPDVETIVGKALEKEADRRYLSAAALAEDIDRYLASRPILARPPSTIYQLRKFAGRNKALVGGVVATFIVLVAGIVVSTVLGLREASQRQQAELARNDLGVVVEFQSGMLSDLDVEGVGRRLLDDLEARVAAAEESRGASAAEVEAARASFRNLTRNFNPTDAALRLLDEEILGRSLKTIEERFGEQPLIDAQLRHTIGATYLELGLYERAEPALEAAVETRTRVLGDADPDTLESLNDLANLYWSQGRNEEAEPLFLEALENRTRILGDGHPDTLESMNNLADLYWSQKRYEEAEPLFVEALDIRTRVLGDDHPDTAESMHNLASLFWSMDEDRNAEVEALYLEALEIRKRALGDDHPATLGSKTAVAQVHWRNGRYDEAERLFLEVLEATKRVQGDDHPFTLATMRRLANYYHSQERFADAESLLLEVLETSERTLGDAHPATFIAVNGLVSLFLDQGRNDNAVSLLLEALETRRRAFGDDHPNTLRSMTDVARVYRNQGRYAEAEPLFLEALETRRRVRGDDHPETLWSTIYLSMVYRRQGRHDQAEPLLLEVLETGKRIYGEDFQFPSVVLYNLACFASVRGDRKKAMDWLRQAVEPGYTEVGYAEPDWMSKDPDLEALHGPEFDAIVEHARENANL